MKKKLNLEKLIRRPEPYVIMMLLVFVCVLVDSFRRPEDQITAALYIGSVRLYQRLARPAMHGWVVCRYHPTCSEYSIEAVQKYGIRYGLVLTFKRVNSCTSDVPLHTHDPVP